MSAAEIIDQSLRIYSKRPLEYLTPFLFSGLINGVVKYLLSDLFNLVVLPRSLSEVDVEWMINYIMAFLGFSSLSILLFLVIGTIVNGMAIKYTSDLLERDVADLNVAINVAFQKFISLLIAGLIYGSLMILGFISFVLPGVFVAVIFSLSAPVIVIEDKGVFESFKRSNGLVRGSWMKVFTVIFIILFMVGIAMVIGEAAGFFFGRFRDVVSMLIVSLVQPIHPIAITLLYYSLHAREKRFEPKPLREGPEELSEVYIDHAVEQVRYCIYCGQRLPFDALFCPRCGRQVKRSA